MNNFFKEYKAVMSFAILLAVVIIVYFICVSAKDSSELQKWWVESYSTITKGDIVIFILLFGLWTIRK